MDSAMVVTSPLKQICTSLSTFKDHREPHVAYVDKTALVAKIVSPSSEKGYFVNRPPKFGKTVLLDTIATYFKGDREAFRGLAIYDMQMPWEEFPIIRFSMNPPPLVRNADQFEASLCSLILRKAKRHDVCLTSPNNSDSTLLFANLVRKVYKKHQKGVVILIDEHDAPIRQCLRDENAELGKEIEEILASFYGVLRSSSSQGYVRFCYVTGKTKPVKGMLTPSLNDLSSIDTSPELSTLCGFTRDEILSTFGPELSEFAKKVGKGEDEAMKDIEDNFSGYNWHHFGDKAGLVFNPYAILSVFKCMTIHAYSVEEFLLPKWLRDFLKQYKSEIASIIGGSVQKYGRPQSIIELLRSPDLNSVRLIMWEYGLLTADFTSADNAGKCRFPNDQVSSFVWEVSQESLWLI